MAMRSLATLLLSCACFHASGMVGANDPDSALALDRLNHQAALLRKLDYTGAVKNLQQISVDLAANAYARPRILNELADLLTNRTFEIESAVAVDREILSLPASDLDKGSGSSLYRPRHMAAVNRLLLDKDHYTEYVVIDSNSLKARAQERLEINTLLLAGLVRPRKATYTKTFLEEALRKIQVDIGVTHPGTSDRKRFVSRLVRADYELFRVTGQLSGAYERFQTGEMKLQDVDFGELTFLELSDYFTTVFNITGNIQFAELALNSVYLPYLGLTDANVRWKYNKIVNGYIATLIEANFKVKRFDEVLYYANLNKSRMLLEERRALAGGIHGSAKVGGLMADDGIPRNAYGLPEKAWFNAKLLTTKQFLDFYVGGTYVAESDEGNARTSKIDLTVMPLSSRNSGRVRTTEPTEIFKDDTLYITQVINGKANAVKLEGAELTALRSEMERAYSAISHNREVVTSTTLARLRNRLQMADSLSISPDKWLATHPLDFHFQTKTVRAVNFFTSGDNVKLKKLAITGFFNPTMDLDGAEVEADVIQALLPQANVRRRDSARKAALGEVSDSNIIHLSMHGAFNDRDPKLSKLMFAGAKKDEHSGDPNALYAEEMAHIAALHHRDLVFAAACQTGLQAADRTNSSELTGILRPLTANRNKNLILSLWNVSDEATAEFVKVFYQRLATSLDVRDAFHRAQDQLRSQNPHPFYWAAFYLSQSN